jgi:hypothetical protein
VYICTYSSKYRDAGRAKEIKKNWDSVPRNSPLVPLVRGIAIGITLKVLRSGKYENSKMYKN